MTAQIAEKLRYEGEDVAMCTNPLSDYFAMGGVNPRFESMFAIGVDEMGWDDLNDMRYDWPGVDEVRRYRQAVRAAVDRLIRTIPLSLPVGTPPILSNSGEPLKKISLPSANFVLPVSAI